ncbi:hypothetical protein MNV49_001298 [Pseudohyphozyma bogoriensis]|nr:hypothetical protein MNV49_001298 [Pseudohyphozyma bogoriensis]
MAGVQPIAIPTTWDDFQEFILPDWTAVGAALCVGTSTASLSQQSQPSEGPYATEQIPYNFLPRVLTRVNNFVRRATFPLEAVSSAVNTLLAEPFDVQSESGVAEDWGAVSRAVTSVVKRVLEELVRNGLLKAEVWKAEPKMTVRHEGNRDLYVKLGSKTTKFSIQHEKWSTLKAHQHSIFKPLWYPVNTGEPVTPEQGSLGLRISMQMLSSDHKASYGVIWSGVMFYPVCLAKDSTGAQKLLVNDPVQVVPFYDGDVTQRAEPALWYLVALLLAPFVLETPIDISTLNNLVTPQPTPAPPPVYTQPSLNFSPPSRVTVGFEKGSRVIGEIAADWGYLTVCLEVDLEGLVFVAFPYSMATPVPWPVYPCRFVRQPHPSKPVDEDVTFFPDSAWLSYVQTTPPPALSPTNACFDLTEITVNNSTSPIFRSTITIDDAPVPVIVKMTYLENVAHVIREAAAYERLETMDALKGRVPKCYGTFVAKGGCNYFTVLEDVGTALEVPKNDYGMPKNWDNQWPEDEGVRRAVDELRTLLEENGVRHGDWRPANVCRRDDGQLVAIDFGLTTIQ